jgi:ABC-type transport system substrate-binding protein
MARVRVLVGAVLAVSAALSLAASSTARPVKEGGTFRVVAPGGGDFGSVDPGLLGVDVDYLRPACESLVAYPDAPLPAGLRIAPDLATSDPIVSKDQRTYTFIVRNDARFSTGVRVTARDLLTALERILNPTMGSFLASYFADIVGAKAMLAGKSTTLAGAVARGRTLTLRLAKPVPDFPARLTELCAVPAGLPVDPEGAKAPIPSAAPYYVAESTPEGTVLERNRFYKGRRPHHVDRIVVDSSIDAATALDQVTQGDADYLWGDPIEINARLVELARRYGVNKSQFFVLPSLAGRMFFLNTSRRLFRGNLRLRQAVNFAVDRKALVREFGKYAATSTDQFLPPLMPGFQNVRIYPLDRPDLRKARSLAAGRTRNAKVVLYIRTESADVAAAQILQRNLKTIGLDVTFKQFPTPVLFQKAETPGEPFDILLLGWQPLPDPQAFLGLFDGRNPQNYSHFKSQAFDRLLDRAGRLSGPERYRAFGQLDVHLARDLAPAIPYAVYTAWTFVSEKAGCLALNPYLDLTAVCLK